MFSTDTKRTLFTAALVALALLSAPALATTETDLGDVVKDAATELQVKTALLSKIGWDMIDTDVEAEGDHVFLLGEAESKANRELAKEVALSIEGVEKVTNELKVIDSPTDAPVGEGVAKAELEVKDAILESRVKAALIGEMGRRAFDIEVEASEGQVSLRGQLDEDRHEKLALETAQGISGVERVIDLIDVSAS
ncbi:MAG: BON domain-containing protein [Acidobacteriota bacterium]